MPKKFNYIKWSPANKRSFVLFRLTKSLKLSTGKGKMKNKSNQIKNPPPTFREFIKNNFLHIINLKRIYDFIRFERNYPQKFMVCGYDRNNHNQVIIKVPMWGFWNYPSNVFFHLLFGGVDFLAPQKFHASYRFFAFTSIVPKKCS